MWPCNKHLNTASYAHRRILGFQIWYLGVGVLALGDPTNLHNQLESLNIKSSGGLDFRCH